MQRVILMGHSDHNGRCPGCVADGLLPNVASHPICPKQLSLVWGLPMTPREALELIKAKGHSDHTLWRDPDGEHYLLSRMGSESRYFDEGFIRLDTLRGMRSLLAEIPGEGIRPGTPLWRLMEDVNRQEGRMDWSSG